MKETSIKKNYIYNMLYQLLIIILPIITTPYLARKLGAEGNGTFGYTVSIVTYFVLFGSLGINLYGQREIAYNQNDKKKRSRIFIELLFFKIFTILIATGIFYFSFCRNGQYAIFYRILIVELIANMIDISWFYQGMEQFKKIVIRNCIIRIISLICIFIFIKSFEDLYKYFYIYVLGILIGNITLWIGIKKYICIPDRINIFRHMNMIIVLFIPQIAMQIYTVLDKTMIGIILNNMDEVGYYEQSQKIIKILLTVITAIGTVMLPRISNCFAEKNYKKIDEYMKKTFRFVFMLAFPLMFGIIAVASNFTPVFFGKGYEKVPDIMRVLSIIVLFISISNITGIQYLLSAKRQKEFTISVLIGAIVNFVLNIIFIRLYNTIGAAISTVIAELCVTLVQLYCIRKDFNLINIFRKSKNYLIASVIMFVVCCLVDYFITEQLVALIIQIISGCITYFLTLLVLRDDFLLDLLKNVLEFIKKKIKRVKK